MNVRVRIAPSPTGLAHIGTAYMGLYNWAYARKHGGVFILRLEDTDRKRHVEAAEKVIYDAFDWLGLVPDESPVRGGEFGPYRQSECLERYRQTAGELLKNQLAYEQDGAVWFKLPSSGEVSWRDEVRGEITFLLGHLKDFVLIKSDGYPTYNFANVVDDVRMKISHVIRGEEHISNTPLQLQLYQALGEPPPRFAHLPVLRNKNQQKLSKRRDPVSLQWFRDQGYLAEALLNFLALQGWSHPEEKDIFSLREFTDKLTLERIKTSAPVFDFKKLDWINGCYIREKNTEELAQLIEEGLTPALPKRLIRRTLPLVQERMKKLVEFPGLVEYFDREPLVERSLLVGQSGKDSEEIVSTVDKIKSSYEKLSNWSAQEIEKIGGKLLEESGWTTRELFMTVRVALSGRTTTPPLFEMMEVLGKRLTLKRLEAAKQLLTGEGPNSNF